MTDLFQRSHPPRKVRSFARRQTRTGTLARQALSENWPRYGLDFPGSQRLDPVPVFGRVAPLYMEIGFGNGDTLLHLATLQPECDFLGIEVHRPGLGRVLSELARRKIGNVRVVCGDAVEVLSEYISDNTLAGVYILFPDPWPKQRHHKRRLVNASFVDLATAKLIDAGVLHVATDWEHYARQAHGVLTACSMLRNQDSAGGFAQRPAYRPVTKFESRGQQLGHSIRDLVFYKVRGPDEGARLTSI